MNSIKKTSFLFLLFAAFFASCAEEEAEVHPCDQDGHIVDTWNVTNYLSVITNADGAESARYTGSSGTMVFRSDGTGHINAPTTGGTINQNITYSTASSNGERTLNIVYAGEQSRTYGFSFNECSQDQVDMTAAVSWSGGRTFSESYAFTRQP